MIQHIIDWSTAVSNPCLKFSDEGSSTESILLHQLFTGTMWCMEIVRQIMYGNDDELLNKSKALPQIGHLLEMGQGKTEIPTNEMSKVHFHVM